MGRKVWDKKFGQPKPRVEDALTAGQGWQGERCSRQDSPERRRRSQCDAQGPHYSGGAAQEGDRRAFRRLGHQRAVGQRSESGDTAGRGARPVTDRVSGQDDAQDDKDNWDPGREVLAGNRASAAPRRASPTALASTSPASTSSAIDRMVATYADCFPDELPSELSVSRPVEFSLTLKADARPSSRTPFRLSKTEPDVLQLFMNELLRKKWIEVSDSPWVSSIFSVLKKNPVTGKAPSRADWLRSGNASLPVRWVVENRLSLFSTPDLAQGYHQMRLEPSSRMFTAFRTDKETYQWCVPPMGLAGMPGVWSRLMRLLFGSFDFVVVYLDDLCIFSRTELEHIAHVAAVCEVLRSQKLYARLSKCRFVCTSVGFLGHTVPADSLRVDERKTRAIEQWPVLASVKSLQSFLGLCGYYRRFIGRFADIVLPLSNLMKKGAAWTWTDSQQRAFLRLKAALQQSPVLDIPDYSKRFVVTTGASGFCCGAVLSQEHGGVDHPVAFLSMKLSRHELDKATKHKFLRGYRRDPLSEDIIKASTPATHELAEVGTIRRMDGLLYIVLWLCVPTGPELRTALVAEANDGPVAAHAGIRRTQQRLALWYFWPSPAIDVKASVQSCSTCIRFK
ncbi:unnamed protein product [Phytophthora fragariaefolia]|uniref:Unnamed protein product n=1 Tax=Phytophthora fragariaefolia TaxID=1490495 RepID=A0A9W6XYD8_9STRA|nr:unnamed protein product [Phytophthora fragariaefolia]